MIRLNFATKHEMLQVGQKLVDEIVKPQIEKSKNSD